MWKDFVGALPDDQKEPARELNRALDRGHISLSEFSIQINQLTGKSPKRIEDVINHDEMHKNTDLLDYIKELHRHYKTGILSNVSSDWIRNVFLTSEEQTYFDDILLSHQVGAIKPDPIIYKMAAKQLGVKEEDCVFIDDGVRNCEGAQAVGMKAILYENLPDCRQHLGQILANQS